MAQPSEQDRRANRRFWLGILGFFALIGVILGLGLVCRTDPPPGDPSPNAAISRQVTGG